VSADSSSHGIGAEMVQQQLDGTWRPVTFVSHLDDLDELNDVKKRYAQVEKECLALTLQPKTIGLSHRHEVRAID
jgi:hypothetical protein